MVEKAIEHIVLLQSKATANMLTQMDPQYG